MIEHRDIVSAAPSSPLIGDRFGELLSRYVSLTRHEIYEVLEEQSGNHKRFGQIAIQLGLCEPVHVWQAWSTQLLGRTPRVDLKRFGIDSQATSDVPAWLAVALGVVPVRSMEDRLVIAASDSTLARATEVLTAKSTKPIAFVLADKQQVEEAISRYYHAVPPRLDVATPPHACTGRRCADKCRGEACAAFSR
jgi:type IV pilus assembly protein PilB